MSIRCFVAINLDERLKRDLYHATEELRDMQCDVKWIPMENVHITLKFLGDTPEEFIPKIGERLAAVSGTHTPFSMKLHGAGVFPDRRRPRVVWIDILDSDELTKLQKKVEESLVFIGFKEDNRPFTPHLTIGRVRSPKGNASLVRMVETLKENDFGIIKVEKISLMKSDLKPSAAQYTSVAEYYLWKEGG
jgi:RNA 2',3'-cyclic 3'-phosphodiesterase